ncbi:MAG: recombinase family protein, partial [Pseudomonadota bacterium]
SSGGVGFSRGRLYHLLSNPIYIGKIRHHHETYDGRHDAIIDAALWAKVQAKLAENRRTRASRRNAKDPSPLAGKVFDETGARLAPSHTNKQGRRYRYYASGRWRLPARAFEALVGRALQSDPEVRLTRLEQGGSAETSDSDLVERIDLCEDHLRIRVRLSHDRRHNVVTPFKARRRGVETKLVLEDAQQRQPDLVLLRRVRRAMGWVDRIKAGETVAAIAADENITGGFVSRHIDLALLSPEILAAMMDGRQRADLSARALGRMAWSAHWARQAPVFLEARLAGKIPCYAD